MATDDGLPRLTRDEMVARLAATGTERVDRYAALLRASIWMRAEPSRIPGPLDSRFGGPAMAPPDFEWPTYVGEPYLGRDPDDDPGTFTLRYATKRKLPMFLIAQLNLADIPVESILPRTGLLSFFTDPFDGVWGHSKSDAQGIHIRYTPQEEFAALVPHEMPDRSQDGGAFAGRDWPCYAIDYYVKWSMSDWEAYHGLLDLESSDVSERIEEALHEASGYSFGQFLLDGGLNHQGDPRAIAVHRLEPVAEPQPDEYGDVNDEEQQREFDRRASEWTALLSITKDEHLRPVVSDTGGLTFLVRKADLAERRFDRAWIVRS